jgi:hypothetical protein
MKYICQNFFNLGRAAYRQEVNELMEEVRDRYRHSKRWGYKDYGTIYRA